MTARSAAGPRGGRSNGHPGVVPFSLEADSRSPQFSGQFQQVRDFVAAMPGEPRPVAIADSVGVSGVKLEGASSVAYSMRSRGVRFVAAGSDRRPTRLLLRQLADGPGLDRHHISIATDVSPFLVDDDTDHPVASIAVPLSALTVDLTSFNLIDGETTPAPPISWNGLNALTTVLTAADLDEESWTSASAIDRFLIGLASLIIGAIVDHSGSPDLRRGTSWLRDRADALVNSRYSDPGTTPAVIASALGVSLRSLYRLYEGHLGVAEQLRRLRVERAASLLGDGHFNDLPVSEVARRSGFGSVASLGRTFTLAYGVSPQRYRSGSAGHSGSHASAVSE
jgi:AraC-like DNA-binding protein